MAPVVYALPIPDPNLAFYGDISVLARGDAMEIPLGNRISTTWIFKNSGTDGLYDLKYTEKVGSNYTFKLSREQSESLDTGLYSVVIQNSGANAIKEVSYTEVVNVSGFKNSYLTSPYKRVQDVLIGGKQPRMVFDKLRQMIDSDSDDKLLEYKLDVQEPKTFIKSIDQINDTAMYIGGSSNLRAGIPVYILWDEERQVTNRQIQDNTFSTVVKSPNSTSGTGENIWEIEIIVDLQNTPVGRHWITATANGKTTRVYHDIREAFGDGFIPNTTIKYMDGGVVVTPTPVTVIQTVTVPVDRTVIQTVIITTKPYPKNAIGEEYDPSVKPDIGYILFPLAMVGLGIVVLRRMRFQ